MQFVTAYQLNHWAETAPLDIRAEIAELIASLVRASCRDLAFYRFPAGNASQTHGWDGVSDVTENDAFVPAGRTLWEFGAGRGYKAKADSDYETRTRELTLDQRERHSFIFVTPRIWDTGLENWINGHSNDGWRVVRVYDAVALETWLGDRPAVAIRLAKRLGIVPTVGFQTVQEFWEEHSLNTNPPLMESLLLRGREVSAKRLCEGLSTGLGGLSKWQADSTTEAALFIAAAIRMAEAELSQFLVSKTLFIFSEAGARQLPPTGGFNLVLFPDSHRLGAGLARTNQVLLVMGADNLATDVQSLDQMSTQDFASGLQAMGIEENEAFRLAGICCRSVVVFSRLNASGIVTPPDWCSDTSLTPLLLAGSWDGANENDRAIIAALGGKNYDQIDLDARRLLRLPDAPLNLDGSIWTIRSPKDAFTLIGSLIGNLHQQRLRDACISVFSEIDQTLDVIDEEQPVIPTRGEDFRHSEWLRRGLSRTLLLISGLHQAAGFRTILATPEQFVDDVVGALPHLPVDIRTLASLKAEFPTLIEAAPYPLASALERVLEGDPKDWASVIFRGKEGSPLFARTSPHTFVLWAMETLAWNPAYLYQASSILLKLAQFDPGGATQNRPMDSLRRIFLAWRPQTYASLEERISVVHGICNANREAGFKLALALLPVAHDNTHDTARPSLRDFGDAANVSITNGQAATAYEAFGALAVGLADGHADRLTALIDRFAGLNAESRALAIVSIRSAARLLNATDRYELWTKLRVFTQRHKGFQGTDWALPEEHLRPLEALCKEIAPTDPVQRDLWQFNDLVPKMESRNTGDYIEDANRRRREVIRQILNDRGMPAVLALAQAAKEPHLVGYALAEGVPSEEIIEAVLESEFSADCHVSMDFFAAVSGAAHFRFGTSWDNFVAGIVGKSDPKRSATLFLRWPDNRDTWTFVQGLGPSIEEEYWRRKYSLHQSVNEDLLFAIEKYNSVGRFSASADLIAYQEDRVPTEVCIETLRGLVGEINANKTEPQYTIYSVLHVISALQKRDNLSVEELALLEYQYLPILDHQGEPVALVQLLKKSPQFFIHVVCDVFRPASQKEREDVSEDERTRARFGYQILQSMRTLPGLKDNILDADALRAWVAEARDLARREDREAIADQQIGQMLAHAPKDLGDSAWPTSPLRNIIEELASTEIERGIAISRFNMRGVSRKSLYEGGAQERALADQYRVWASAASRWPRTSSMLRRIADSWDQSAEQADTRAELDQRLDS